MEAARTDVLAPMLDNRQPRRSSRAWRADAARVTRPSGILDAPVIEIVASEDADPDELAAKVGELRANGHQVRVVEPDIPDVVTVSENPLSGHSEVLSATVSDDEVIIVTHGQPDAMMQAALKELALAVARSHGSSATKVTIKTWGPRPRV